MIKNENYEEIQPMKWLRSKDVREMLGISESTLQNMRIKAIIPAYKLGSTWFYREDEILASILSSKIANPVYAND